jgi:hypothetical protein
VVPASGGTFGQTSDCTAGPVPAYGTCSITITFAPSIIGTAQATLCFTSNSAYGQASNPLCPAASSASYGIQSITLLGVGEAPVVPAVVGQLPGATFSPPPALFKEIPLGNKIPAIAEHGSITLQALEGGLAALRYPVADRTVRQLILSAAGPVLPTALVGVSPERASTYEERMMIRAPEAMLQFQPTSNAQGVSRFAMQRFVAGPSGFIALDATARVWTDASAGSDLAATAVYERSADVWYVAVQRAEVSSTTRQSVTVYRLAARMAIPTPRVVGRYTRTLSRALAMSSEAFVPGSRALAAALTCDGSLYVSGVFEGEDGLEGLQVLQMPVMEPTC